MTATRFNSPFRRIVNVNFGAEPTDFSFVSGSDRSSSSPIYDQRHTGVFSENPGTGDHEGPFQIGGDGSSIYGEFVNLDMPNQLAMNVIELAPSGITPGTHILIFDMVSPRPYTNGFILHIPTIGDFDTDDSDISGSSPTDPITDIVWDGLDNSLFFVADTQYDCTLTRKP